MTKPDLHKRALPVALALCLVLVSGISAAAGVMETHEEAVADSIGRGDQKALAEALDSMITEHPLEPVSVLHYTTLFRMAELWGPVRVEKTARAAMAKIGAGGDRGAASCRLQLACGLEEVLYRAAPARAKEITDTLKPVRKWTLYGPYRRYGAADLDHQFQPELIASTRDISPRKRIVITGSDGWLNPGKYVFHDHGVVYASASLRAMSPVKIRLFSGSTYKVFINGREAVRNTADARRDVRILRVRGTRGITVTVKMAGPSPGKLRMLITDERDTVIEPEIIPEGSFSDECDVSEELDYPHASLAAEAESKSEKADWHLGLFFDTVGSGESVGHYRASVSKQTNPLRSYHLARALLRRSGGDRGSADFCEGMRIIQDIRERHPGFVPAGRERVEQLISAGDLQQACREGRRLVSALAGNPFTFESYLKALGALGYEKEFEETVAAAKKKFPGFVPFMELEAEYYKKRDRARYISLAGELLKLDFSVTRAGDVLKEYLSRGDYRSAQRLVQLYNHNNDFNRERIEIHIRMGDLKTARDLIFKELTVNEQPYHYSALGLIDILQGEDPSMYLQKALQLQPSLFTLSDYLRYREHEGLDNPFNRYADTAEPVIPESLMKTSGGAASTVLYRGRIFLLQNDGSSRVFCEDIVHVGNDEGVRRWGDFRIPYRGRIRPVRLRVYDGKGGTADSYFMQAVRNDRYVSITALKKNSILHLAYIVDNPAITLPGSGLFSIPPEFLQHWDEPVRKVSIKVIAPAGMKVNFLFRSRVPVKKTPVEGLQQHEAVLENIPAVRREPYAGRLNCLHYFSFSTMDGVADFTAWYRGLLSEKNADHPLPAEEFRRETLEKTIAAVYDHVARDIDLRGSELYLPDSAANTRFRKSGSAEDKVILARSLLQGLGIRSYIALARNRFLPGAGTYCYPGYFTRVLLCVPLELDRAVWLDFSSRHFRCGVTADAVSGANAVVLLNDSYRVRRVQSLDERSTAGRYDIVIRDDGIAACDARASFTGSMGEMRSHFSDSRYREERVHGYFSDILPGFTMDGFQVENYEECERPFALAAKGLASGIAVLDSRRIILRPVLSTCRVYDYVTATARTLPLVIENTIDEREKYRYTLPSRYVNQEVARTHELKNRFGSCRVVITKKRGSSFLEAEKEIHIKATTIQPAEYNEFVTFCLELKRIENDTVMLKQEDRLDERR